MITSTVTIPACSGCCGSGCVTNDLSAVITGTDPCSVVCLFEGSPPAVIGAAITATADISGGYDVPYTGDPDSPSYQGFGEPFDASVYTDNCDGEPTAVSTNLVITVFCHATPNADGKRYGARIYLSTGGANFYLANLEADEADWFNLGEEVELVTPCGTYTLLVMEVP